MSTTTTPSNIPPLIPRISAADILIAEPIPPPPDPKSRAASQSAVTNRLYEEFHADRLIPFDNVVLQTFRDYINRMSRHIDFDGNITGHPLPSSLPLHHGHAMRSEADVRVFANSFYIDPVRPVLLEMLPDQNSRTYDWRFPSEVNLPSSTSASSISDSSIPDMALSQRTAMPTRSMDTDRPVVLIEFKAPHMVYNSRNEALKRRDMSPDWKAMTKQLRKYSTAWKCRRLILMDERMAWFFYLGARLFGDPESEIYYTYAEAPGPATAATSPSTPPTPPYGPKSSSSTASRESFTPHTEIFKPAWEPVSSSSSAVVRSSIPLPPSEAGPSTKNQSSTTSSDIKFTIRELIAFAGYHALEDDHAPGIRGQRDYSAQPTTIRPCNYKALFQAPLNPPDDGTDERPQRHKKSIRYFSEATFTRVTNMALSSDDYLVSPEFFHPQKYSSVHFDPCNSDTESGYHSDSDRDSCSRMLHLTISKHNILSSANSLAVKFTHRFNSTVSVATTTTTHHPLFPTVQLVTKRFSRRIHLLQELRAYSALLDQQGNGIPGCIGVFTTPVDSDPDALYLLLEYVPHPTLATSTSDWRWVKDDTREVITKLHERGVCHGDLSASNVLVDPEDERAVVVVDFGMAWVGEEANEMKMEDDWAAFEWLFRTLG
ncbi:hypothetical protein BDD12DRAFT_843159 [Trichophaea hybrida]|nr:hypothetical protein BDD12DRAFT_843159 [Trichophaea hybrida]